MTYVLLFISLRDMPDLCPKGTDLHVKPSALSCSLTLPLYPRLLSEKAESGYPSRRGCLSLGRNSNTSNCGQDYLEYTKST